MGKTKQIIISEFDGGITRDLRVQSTNKFRITKNFDNYSDKKRLIPLRSLVANENKPYGIVQFLEASTKQIYGLGRIGTTNQKTQIYQKGANIVSGDWTTVTNGVSGTAARNEKVFFEYKNYLYSWAVDYLQRWGDFTGSPTFTHNWKNIVFTNIAQPVHHPADDIAYFFYDNKIAKLNNTAWTLAALTLPDNLIITCACAYGDYLAIGCKSKRGAGNSTVFLWDRDSSLNTISEKIDWGMGNLAILAVLNGILIGISSVNSDGNWGEKPKIHIKGYAGSLSFLQELDMDAVTSGDYAAGLGGHFAIQNDKLYFDVYSSCLVAVSDVNFTGIWVVGRHELGSPFSVTMAHKINTEASVNIINGFNLFQDYLFVAHSNDGSVDRTNASAVYATASYESQIFTGNDSSQTKKLLSVTVMTEPQPTAGQTLLYYKRDAETSWIPIFTNATDDDIRHTAINIESSGADLGEFKEIQFKIESKGNSIVTGLKFKYEEIDNDIA